MTKTRFFLDWSKRQKAFFLVVLSGWIALVVWIFHGNEEDIKKTPTDAAVTGSLPQTNKDISTISDNEVITQEDMKKAARVAEKFVPVYTTYSIIEIDQMIDQIQPYVTDAFFEQEKANASQIRPTVELQGFQYIKMDQPRIKEMDNQLYWTALVTVESIQADGKKDPKRYNYVIQLVKDGSEWKIIEVDFREFTEEDEKQA